MKRVPQRDKNMKARTLQWLAILFIAQAAILHWINAEAQYQKMPYMGYAAMGFAGGELLAVFLIYHRKRLGWWLGSIMAMGSIGLFILTRLVALPGLAVEQWLYPFWLIGSGAEALYILLFLLIYFLNPSIFIDRHAAFSPQLAFLVPVLGAILITGITYNTHHWDNFASQLSYHRHVGSLRTVSNTPPITLAELKEHYGVKISRVSVTALGTTVDVRLKIINAEKAKVFLQNQGAILVNQNILIISPDTYQPCVHGVLPHPKWYCPSRF